MTPDYSDLFFCPKCRLRKPLRTHTINFCDECVQRNIDTMTALALVELDADEPLIAEAKR